MPTPIPLARPDITQHEIHAVMEVLSTPTLSIGPWLDEFERMVANLTGRRHAIGVSSGTAGLHCAMIAAGIRPEDEVITTPFSFVASANCILYVGAKRVFVDIDPQTMNVDLDKLTAAINSKTRAVVGGEVFGKRGGMPELEQIAQKHELVLIEDACEGLGCRAGKRPIGSFGRASIFGFYPNKQITTGEGGMIVTDDEYFASTCRALRNQGREGMSWLAHQRLGYNYRLSEINAALGVAQMQRLKELTEKRHNVAVQYIERLMTSKFVTVPTILENTVMSWFVFVVRLNDLFEMGDRDEAIKELRSNGIGCSNYFPPIHLQPYMVELVGHKAGDFPICEHVANRTIALPFFGKMTKSQIERVCDTLEKVLEKILVSRKGRF